MLVRYNVVSVVRSWLDAGVVTDARVTRGFGPGKSGKDVGGGGLSVPVDRAEPKNRDLQRLPTTSRLPLISGCSSAGSLLSGPWYL